MRTGIMVARVMIIAVIIAGAPIRRRLPFQQRDQAAALHIRWDRQSRDLHERRREISINRDCILYGARLGYAGPADEEWHLDRGFVHKPLVIQAVIAEE